MPRPRRSADAVMRPLASCLALGLAALIGCAPDAIVTDAAVIGAADSQVVFDASTPADSGETIAPDAGLLPFGATCTSGPECETGLCYNFAARGMRCTSTCTNGVCPVPP